MKYKQLKKGGNMIINEKDYVQCLEVEHIENKDIRKEIWRGLHYYDDYYIETKFGSIGVKHPFSDAPEYIQERKRRYDAQMKEIQDRIDKEQRREERAGIIGAIVAFIVVGVPFIYAAATDQWLAPFIFIGIFVMLFGSIFGIGKGLPGD